MRAQAQISQARILLFLLLLGHDDRITVNKLVHRAASVTHGPGPLVLIPESVILIGLRNCPRNHCLGVCNVLHCCVGLCASVWTASSANARNAWFGLEVVLLGLGPSLSFCHAKMCLLHALFESRLAFCIAEVSEEPVSSKGSAKGTVLLDGRDSVSEGSGRLRRVLGTVLLSTRCIGPGAELRSKRIVTHPGWSFDFRGKSDGRWPWPIRRPPIGFGACSLVLLDLCRPLPTDLQLDDSWASRVCPTRI